MHLPRSSAVAEKPRDATYHHRNALRITASQNVTLKLYTDDLN